ncbi:MAG TPA: ABC transporter substrate-binding protein, partial [Gemmatimonadales bacterium]
AYLPSMDTPQNQRFVRTYRERYPNAGLPNQPAAATYDALFMLRDVIAVTGSDRQAIRDGLNGLGTSLPPYQGITGILAFEGRGDLARLPVLIGVVRNGTVVPVERPR